jgi:hypothetical protein
MLEKRYIPWLWTQGCCERVRTARRCHNDTWSYLECKAARRFVIASEEVIMAKKKKDRLRVHKEARRLARLGVGMPPSERTIPDKRQKAPKHKKKLVAPDLN